MIVLFALTPVAKGFVLAPNTVALTLPSSIHRHNNNQEKTLLLEQHSNNNKFARQLVIRHYGGGVGDRRAAEIRRKIAKLKKEGRLKKQQQQRAYDDDDDDDDLELTDVKEQYGSKIRQKLGDGKSKMLGYTVGDDDDDDSSEFLDDNGAEDKTQSRVGQIGALPTQQQQSEDDKGQSTGYVRAEKSQQNTIIDASLFDDDSEGEGNDEPQLSEEELVDMVAMKMNEKRERERREKEARLMDKARDSIRAKQGEAATSRGKTTSGVGGSWNKNETKSVEMYKPKTGSWGAFPRPKDISKAYGGGRRVGPGYSNEESRLKSQEDTRERLRQYREKVGIEVQSEKEHAAEIDEAVKIAGLAMQRGMYSTAVSALEKVTKYCSSNSKVGGKVFLELAMAYEAVGRTEEAIRVYTVLSRCRMEEIKFNAKRLLYGIEAMQFMQKEMKDSNFSRKKAKNTFIDTTGLKYISQNFDDVYQTAYVDMEGTFYKRLTESVVRSPREARQILLRATNAGEVDRMRIVQALRSISRNFEDALEAEIERNTVKEPVAVLDGRPILAPSRPEEFEGASGSVSPNGFVLAASDQMMENLNGEWRLQLLADKRGDGVTFFNKTLSFQEMNLDNGVFRAQVPVGFGNVQLSGGVEFNEKKRVLRRRGVETSGGGVFSGFMDPLSGASGAIRSPQQVMTVDSEILVTRGVPPKKRSSSPSSSSPSKDDEKNYFAVWRRVD